LPSVRIVRRPDGEAPEWVRDAWIGLELPLACPEPITTRGFGAVTGPRNAVSELVQSLLGRWKPVSGYIVPAFEAVELLSRQSPEAAAWWRCQAKFLVSEGRTLLFDTPACERVP
jgi:hypothetical protein